MNPDSRNFEALRRLLKLKRHEEPPPGYFDRFSRDVMARIKAGETGVSFELPWWQSFFGLFDLKPVFAGAFGMGVCALLISGVIASETDKPRGLSATSVVEGNAPMVNPVAIALPAAGDAVFVSSTNPVAPGGSGSLFDQFPQVRTTLATDRRWVPNGN